MSRADYLARGKADLRPRQICRAVLFQRGGAVFGRRWRPFPEVEEFWFSVEVQETVALVLHVALYAQGRGLCGAAVKAFVPFSDFSGQVPNEALQVYDFLWVWDEHPVGGVHVFEVFREAGVVCYETLVAE